MTTATLTQTRTDKFGFPIVTCYRCGGSGRFSFNQITGDRCFGCNGSGVCWKRGKVAKAAVAYHEALRKAKSPVVRDLVKGQVIACNPNGNLYEKGRTWWTFESMEIDYSQVTGSSKNFKTGEYEPMAWKCVLTLTNGETTITAKSQTNIILNGKTTHVDVKPFLVAAGVQVPDSIEE